MQLIEQAGVEVDAKPSAAVIAEGMLLSLSASLFTTVWLQRSLGQALCESMPALCNSDGEPLLFYTLRFPLTPAAGHAEVKTALDTLPMLEPASERFLTWSSTVTSVKADADLAGKGGRKLISTLEDGSVVLGGIELEDDALVFSANSATRAEQGQALLADLLVGSPEIEVQTLEELRATGEPEGKYDPASEIPPEVARSLLKDQLDRHYRKTLDQPIPSLGNCSPRASLKTAKGRAKVAEWLKYLENQTRRHHAPDDPLGAYDFAWFWQALGIEELRR